MSKRILSMALISAVIAIAAVGAPRLIQYLEDGFDHTNHVKIVDLSGTLSQTNFKLPVGWMRRFVIGHPASSDLNHHTTIELMVV
jgi:hypothetical protein